MNTINNYNDKVLTLSQILKFGLFLLFFDTYFNILFVPDTEL